VALFRKKSIDEWALDYWLLQLYAKFWFHIYYRKVEVINRQNIPRNQPVIMAPNHQNALMDAMILICNTPLQIVFLARADIFKGKRLIKFLNYLNIMPIYRIRDGIENVKKNDEVFERTIQVLHNKHNPLVLFPEGNHGNRRRLRPLVKGLFRIAFQAQEKYGTLQGVKILPVGYDYGHYTHFRTTLLVNIGEPIDVSEFMETYRGNPVIAVNALRERFASALGKLMIDIQTEEYYELYMQLRETFNREMRHKLNIQGDGLAAKFRADKVMIEALNRELEARPDNIRDLNMLMSDYQSGLKKYGLRDWVLNRGKDAAAEIVLAALLKLIFIPVFVFGFINNYLPYWLTESRTRNIKDLQFHSSFKYVVGMIVFPVWYLVIAGMLLFTTLPGWAVLTYIFFLPFSGLFAFHYFIRMKKFLARCRFYLIRNSGGIQDLLTLRKEILQQTSDIITRQLLTNENSG
jgi:1-acyl-sn-glycerol-3-phosphate acyltransferase